MFVSKRQFLATLSQNLLESLNNEEYYDITIEVGNDPLNMKTFHAHTVILNCRSPYLRRVLSTNKKKDDGTLVHIKLPNISPEIFQIILSYIYGAKILLDNCDTSDIVKILVAANELSLQELVNYLQSFLIKSKANWVEKNFNLIFHTSFENDSFLELQKCCIDLMSKEPEKIFNSLNFSLISEKFLVSLIQNNNRLDVIQVWKHVLGWGLAQNPELPSDITNFSKNDITTLKNTLQRCIPLIRFDVLTCKEFRDNILPYKEILPDDLFIDLLKLFLDSDYKPSEFRIDSKIITFQHAELISKWIDRLEITDKVKNSYKFKLLFRESRDGLTSKRKRFHEICDNQSRTVSIVKVKGSNEILGGYNPIAWKPSYDIYDATKDSFIFSFKNKDSIKNNVLSRVIDEKKAIYNSSHFGPSFGYGDITIWEVDLITGDCSSKMFSYEKPIRKNEDRFFVEECEVFQIIDVNF